MSDNYTIKEMQQMLMTELRELKTDSGQKLDKIEQHLAQLNSKVATHELQIATQSQSIADGKNTTSSVDKRLTAVEFRIYGIQAGAVVIIWLINHFFF